MNFWTVARFIIWCIVTLANHVPTAADKAMQTMIDTDGDGKPDAPAPGKK